MKYHFYCKGCGFALEADTKEQWAAVKKFHKKTGCIFVDTKLKNPVYTRPEINEWYKETFGKKEKQ